MPKGNGPRVRIMTEMQCNRISELYLKGKSFAEIGVAIGAEFRPDGSAYTAGAISRQLKKIRADWRTSRLDNYDAKIDLELSRIDQIEREAWEAWQRSIGIYKTLTTKTTKVKAASGDSECHVEVDIPADEITEKREKMAGDPRFLEVVHKCVNKRCELLGLDAPKRTSLENPDGSALLSGITITYVAPPAQASDGNAGS